RTHRDSHRQLGIAPNDHVDVVERADLIVVVDSADLWRRGWIVCRTSRDAQDDKYAGEMRRTAELPFRRDAQVSHDRFHVSSLFIGQPLYSNYETPKQLPLDGRLYGLRHQEMRILLAKSSTSIGARRVTRR